MLSIRCSSLPRFMECPSSEQAPKTGQTSKSGPLAATGIAAHDALSSAVRGQDVDVARLASESHVNPNEVGMLLSHGMKQWRTIVSDILGGRPTELMTEVGSEQTIDDHITLTGHADVVASCMATSVIADWKTGYRITEPRWQLNGYKRLFGCDIGVVCWVRDDVIDVYDDLLDNDAFDELLVSCAQQIGKSEVYGEHCLGCHRNHECETYRTQMRHTITVFDQTSGDLYDVADLVKVYPRVKLLEQHIARYKSALRHAVEMSKAESLDLGDGTELYLQSTSQDVIDAEKAFPIATRYVSREEFLGSLKIGKTALMNIVRSKAQRGKKAEIAGQFLSDLRNAGAVTQKQVAQIRQRRIVK